MYLGNTLSEIAGEKAGIIKPGIPVVSAVGTGETEDERIVLSVVERFCKEKGAPLFLHGRDFLMEQLNTGKWDYWAMKRKGCCQLREKIKGLSSRLKGKYQAVNAGVALATLEILDQFGFSVDEETVRTGLLEVTWPGRLESFCLSSIDGRPVDCTDESAVHYMLDGAHNPAGVAALFEALANDYEYTRLILVWAAMSDKDFRAVLPRIAKLAGIIIFTRLEYERSSKPEDMVKALPEEIRDRVICDNSLDSALQKAAEIANPDDLICIAGSLYLVGKVRAKLLGELV